MTTERLDPLDMIAIKLNLRRINKTIRCFWMPKKVKVLNNIIWITIIKTEYQQEPKLVLVAYQLLFQQIIHKLAIHYQQARVKVLQWRMEMFSDSMEIINLIQMRDNNNKIWFLTRETQEQAKVEEIRTRHLRFKT